jgi:hypothetical protein
MQDDNWAFRDDRIERDRSVRRSSVGKLTIYKDSIDSLECADQV